MSQLIQAHWEALAVFAGWALLAAAATMPKPGDWKGWATLYAWLYAFVQEMLSLRSQKLAGPQPPAITVPGNTYPAPSGLSPAPTTFQQPK